MHFFSSRSFHNAFLLFHFPMSWSYLNFYPTSRTDDIESCGAIFFGTPSLKCPVTFSLTQTESPQKENFTTQTQTDQIIFYQDQNIFFINPKLLRFGTTTTNCEHDPKWSKNILQHVNQCPMLAVLTQFGNARHGFHLIHVLNLKHMHCKGFWDNLKIFSESFTFQSDVKRT